MRLLPILPLAAICAFAAGAAVAETAPSVGMTDQAAPRANSANQAAIPAAAAIPPGDVASSPTPADQAFTLKAGDPNLITNGPVPDTAANRQLYGGPMSNAGRHTAPKGD